MISQPFKSLGNQLKMLREQGSESLLEASGAVEIDADALRRIEDGIERPSEDILLLLIQHYGMAETDAAQLWDLAGYDLENTPESLRFPQDNPGHQHKQMIMLLAMDVRTLYSDGADIVITPGGLTISFTQSAGNDKHTPVSRVGMSYDQAAELLKTLESALLRAHYLKSPRTLPAPKPDGSAPNQPAA